MLRAISTELALRYQELKDKNIQTIYFGGGTPSILEPKEIAQILDHLAQYYDWNSDAEITLEANPDDLSSDFLKEIKQIGINRLSIGTQSFFEEDLKMMNRAHNASEAESSIKRAQDIGLENISIDLIYGSPTSTMAQWRENLDKVIALEVPHISSYALTVEPKTAIENWISNKKIKAPDESFQNDAFFYMSDFLKNSGFEHYEISNFAKPGFESKHNSAYWSYRAYLGLGPSAHSYNGKNERSWNAANNIEYVKKLLDKQLPTQREVLSDKDRYNEMLMIGLRTKKGVDLQAFRDCFSSALLSDFNKSIEQKIKEGILVIDQDRLYIPEKHWFLADGIAADLFSV